MKIGCSHQAGFSLLEVLVALVILTIALLGISRIGLLALCEQQAAYFRTIANIQAQSIADRVRLSVEHCPEFLDQFVREWQAENKTLLPQSNSRIEISPNNYLIVIQWNGSESSRLQIQR